MALPAEAARVLYRSLLRTCGRGKHPEVLHFTDWPGPTLRDAPKLPKSSKDVVDVLRSSFMSAEPPTSPASSADVIDPFTALRNSAASARALRPVESSATLPDSLPAFVLPSHTLLPGERADFVLFEPRYRRLAETVLNDAPCDGRYAHLPEGPPSSAGAVGVLTTILQHSVLPDGRVMIHVLAGPRCKATRTARLEEVGEAGPDGRPAPPPLVHIEYELYHDLPSDDAHVDAVLARDCLERLTSLAPSLHRQPSLAVNLPPLFCAERLSFWLSQLMLRNDDAPRRREWLRTQSTYERLIFLSEALNQAQSQRSTDDAEAAS